MLANAVNKWNLIVKRFGSNICVHVCFRRTDRRSAHALWQSHLIYNLNYAPHLINNCQHESSVKTAGQIGVSSLSLNAAAHIQALVWTLLRLMVKYSLGFKIHSIFSNIINQTRTKLDLNNDTIVFCLYLNWTCLIIDELYTVIELNYDTIVF